MDNEIAVDARAALGKHNRRLRTTGIVPGVVYGKGTGSTPVQMDAKAFEQLYRSAGRTSLVNLHVGSGRAQSAIIKSVQRHPLTGNALHVDFFLVDLKVEMEVDVPLVFTGVAPAVELTGGTVVTNLSQLRVKALPGDLPHEIAVDVSVLVDLDAAVHVRDLPIPAGVQVMADGDELVAKVLPPRVEEEPEVAAAEEEAAEGEGEAGAEAAGEAGGERTEGGEPAGGGEES